MDSEIGKPKRRVIWWYGLCYGLLIIGAVAVVFHIRAARDLGLELTRLQVQVTGLADRNDLLQREAQERLTVIERTLFGDVVAKLDKPGGAAPQARVELWQLNRDRDLRDRLARLEQWRLRTER
jgi:hypothetical protein